MDVFNPEEICVLYWLITMLLWVVATPWWRHQMETFPALLALCVGNSPVTGRWIPLTKGQWRGALMFSLIFAWTNGWVNNWDAGDLRSNRAHYDVTVMLKSLWRLLISPLFITLIHQASFTKPIFILHHFCWELAFSYSQHICSSSTPLNCNYLHHIFICNNIRFWSVFVFDLFCAI